MCLETFLYTQFFWSKMEPNFFRTRIFLDQIYFWVQKFWTWKCYEHQPFFLVQKCLVPNIHLSTPICWPQVFQFDLKVKLNSIMNVLLPVHFFLWRLMRGESMFGSIYVHVSENITLDKVQFMIIIKFNESISWAYCSEILQEKICIEK